MKRILLLITCFIFIQLSSNAQNSDKPWAIGAYYSGMDFRAVDGKWTNLYNVDNWNAGGKFSIGRALNPSLNLVTSFAINRIEITNTPASGFEPTLNKSRNAYDLDLGIQYKFANDYILKQNSWFDPYLHFGVGMFGLNPSFRGLLNAGIGMNFWFNPKGTTNVGLAWQTDYDYLPNFNDYLHHSIGLKFRFGAKDTDLDRIPDVKDACPNVKGLEQFAGCPDSDADGIADKDDNCPNTAGIEAFGGCPDSDGDGIADKDDNCPEAAGIQSLGGCPDADADGIADKDDSCPQVAGLPSLKGCPDADGDGIRDQDDQCPQVAGSSSLNGCPDTDGDGITDKEDKCPNEAGVAARQGCPEPKIDTKAVEQKLSMSASRIQFATGSTVITQSSYPELKKIIAIMNQYPDTKFNIEGYTDNVGNPANNKALSQRRADAVKKYFTGKNIEASRLSSTGYGDANPVTSNATPQGRAKNRRVEIHLAE